MGLWGQLNVEKNNKKTESFFFFWLDSEKFGIVDKPLIFPFF